MPYTGYARTAPGTARCCNGAIRRSLWKVRQTGFYLIPAYNTISRLNWHGSSVTGARLACIVLLWAGVWIAVTRTTFSQESPMEYQVKAAYLFNFLKFVDWPEDSTANVNGRWVIGIVGGNPFGDGLTQAVSGKIVQGRLLQVKVFQPADDLRTCHILFISRSEMKRLPSILTALRGSSVLTVGDGDGFNESGGMVQFVIEEGRVRFAIDIGATSRARLKVSSKLLSLARSVTGTEPRTIN